MICKNCNAQVSKNYRICPKCGKPLRHPKFALFLSLGIAAVVLFGVAAVAIGFTLGKSGNKPQDATVSGKAPDKESEEKPAETQTTAVAIPKEIPEDAPQGTCGENLKWWIDESSSTLYIVGEGAMKNYTYGTSAPWQSQKSKNVVVEGGVISIGNLAFYNCASLTSITIPDSVTSIGDYAFSNCASLTSITIPDSVTGIGDSAFSNCDSLVSITIPDSVTSIGDYAFSSCDSLVIITIPDSVTSIESRAFYDCNSLAIITIPNSVTYIGYSAFSNCDSLKSITIPDSVTSIGESAFSSCDSLETIHFTGTEKQWNSFGLYKDEISSANVTFGK